MPDTEKFIRRGYFPKELPPTFTSAKLARLIDSSDADFPFKDASKKLKWTHAMTHSLARASHVRRTLGVPNPASHWALANEISQNWKLLRHHAKRSAISLSIPTLRGTQGRAAVPKTPLAGLMFSRVRARAKGRFLLRADIAEFYRSIYTHSISWALHTRSVAKSKMRDLTLLGNRLDNAVGASQYGQTNGLPIGPDTSLVLAEVILGCIDEELQRRIGPLRGIRHHDDYELVFDTAREADEGKAALQQVLLSIGLHLNPLKTELLELPTRIVSDWWVYVKQFVFATAQDERAKIIEFFDETFDRKRHHPTEYVIAYAIGRIEHETWNERTWRVVEALLHQAVLSEPSAAHKFVRVLIRMQSQGHCVDLELLDATIARMIAEHAPYGEASEVSWMIWAAIMFKIPLSTPSCAAISKMQDAFVAISALHAQKRGLADDIDHSVWQASMTTDGLDGDLWLLSYEARVRGWLGSVGGGNHIASHPVFSYLERKKIRFYTLMRKVSHRTVTKLEETDAASYDDSETWADDLEAEFDDDDDSEEEPVHIGPR